MDRCTSQVYLLAHRPRWVFRSPGRLTVLARIILAIPAYLITLLVIFGLETLVMFVTWLIVLIAGRMPRPLHEAIAAGLRYCVRFSGYMFLITGTYPWGLFGDQPWRLVLSSGAKGLLS